MDRALSVGGLRAIWVSPALPHPEAAGGWAHEFELIAALARHHQIEVVSSDLEGPLDASALEAIGVPFHRVRWTPQPHPRGRLPMALTVPRASPNVVLWLKRHRLPALAQRIAEVSERLRPDLIHITLGELAPLVHHVEPPVALLLFDSLTREIETRLAHEDLPRRRVQLWLEARRTEHFERSNYSAAAALASVSSVDGAWFERLLDRPVQVLPNPVADKFFDEPAVPRSADIVTFVGTLNHHPNTDAIEWLADEIWPRVLERRPGARLVVVGRGDVAGVLTRRLRALVEAAGGELHADVDDIRPYYWSAAAVVAPMRLGSGMRNKVIHAMACGAPVVATPAGLEGVDGPAAQLVSVGTSPDDIAGSIEQVLSDPEGAGRRAAEARRAMEALRTERIGEQADAWWRSAVR